ncbi:MAG TPA: M20/M25/M40 family metallo-hydrolase [Bryobacteraceae bacterium]|nr:M20/M25/M40 family metallo-hydrolase [Bryobacteraceae bacterium]
MRFPILVPLFLLAYLGWGADHVSPELNKAAGLITPEGLLAPIKELASDAYAGRLPGTAGEEKSVAYIIAQCKDLRLEPGAPDGGWIQQVPLWGTRSRGSLDVTVAGKQIAITAGQDYVAWSVLPDQLVDIQNSGLVFAGHGVTAPDYRWDDYAGVDVHGKTVIILSGDPPVADFHEPSKLDEKMFLGRALTYYGRTGTKLDNAYAHGAVAAILVSATRRAGGNLFQNYSRENMILRDPQDRKRVKAQAMLGLDRMKEIFAAAGKDLEALRASAARPGFHAVPLAGQASFRINNQVRKIDSANVLAKISGSDTKLKNEYVVYSGHWDHHGQVGDQIFHGASDNAAGTAGVLELARAFRALHPSTRRTLLFLWPTAEEKGLLGAKYYVEHPLYPLRQTVANINLDYFSNWGWGRTRDFSIVGLGNSTLDDVTAQAVARQGRELTGDTAPEQGFYFRSDHFEFARLGVPSVETSPGIDYVGKPAGYGEKKRDEYIHNDYHQPSDVPKPDWDLTGAVQDLQVLLQVGYAVAQADGRPAWKSNAVWRPKSP